MFILIFDIGKTNKKYFVFDENYNIVEKYEYVFPEILDEDEFPCDNIEQIETWLKTTYNIITKKYKITKINFSTYGASFVHLDKKDKVILPIYNYLKPISDRIINKFISKFGTKEDFTRETSSPFLGMLNSGLQLFWLKYSASTKFKQIDTSLHFPQYCSYLFTGNKKSEYTSIGCHTGLWDYTQKKYHKWVSDENIDKILAPIVNSDFSTTKDDIQIGIGIHDSSAALIPYLLGSTEKFILISTGTWSITLNPFIEEQLTTEELNQDCLQFMQSNGKPVRASRLFLGHELQSQLELLNEYFEKGKNYYQKLKFNSNLFDKLDYKKHCVFHFNELNDIDSRNTPLSIFPNFEHAYHQLMIEIVNRQVESVKLALGNSDDIDTIFIDGGFTKNDLYCKILAKRLPKYKIKLTQLASGSALGAAIIMNREHFNSQVFNRILKVETVKI